jgi:CubicO group peptidase (beta-lactamase class C family)
MLPLKAALGALSLVTGYLGISTNVGQPSARDLQCLPFLPRLLTDTPPTANHPRIIAASARLSQVLADRVREHKIDGLSVAVVSSAGKLYEEHWGVRRANESSSSSQMDGDSQYRLASVSKLLLAFEGWQLAERGIISW